MPEVDFRLEEDRIAREDEPGPEDDVPPVVASLPPITQVGDLWILGRHRLLCGDARDEVAYKALLGGESAAMAFSDPPYNVRAVSIGSRGAIKHADFAMAAGEMSREEYMAFLSGCFQRMAAHSVDGAVHFLCTDGYHLAKMTAAIEAAYGAHLPVQRWVKPWGPR